MPVFGRGAGVGSGIDDDLLRLVPRIECADRFRAELGPPHIFGGLDVCDKEIGSTEDGHEVS